MTRVAADSSTRSEVWRVNDVDLAVTVAGRGPLVVLAHGFPDLGLTWRYQLPALRDAGYSVVVPDMRGYGRSSRPADPSRYDAATIARDLVGLVDRLGESRAHFVGHDWGAASVWAVGAMHPDRVLSLTGVAVPYASPAPVAPTEIFRRRLGEDYYMLRFQERDAPERWLAREPRRTLAAAFSERFDELESDAALTAPAWFDDDVFEAYVGAFTATGFGGGINYYRAIDANWRQARERGADPIDPAALFVTGSRDPLTTTMSAERSAHAFRDLRVEVVDGAAHWVHQEQPDAVNELMLAHLRRADTAHDIERKAGV